MNQAILAYASIKGIAKITSWATGLLSGALTLRLLRDGFLAYSDPDVGLKVMFKKSKKRIFATIVGITITGLINWLKSYYW